MTPWEDLSTQAANRPGDPGVRVGDATWTYGRLLAESEAVARGLVAHGVRPGDRVVLHMTNSLELVAGYFACFRTGAIASPVSTRCTSAELGPALRRLAPAVLLGQAELDARVAGVGPDALGGVVRFVTGQVPRGSGARPWEELMAAGDGGGAHLPSLEELDPAVPAVLLATSGTTGEPKFVAHTTRTLSGSIEAAVRGAVRQEGMLLAAPPMVHVGSLLHGLTQVHRGAPLMMLPAATAEGVLDAIGAYGCTDVLALPHLFAEMVELQRSSPRRLGPLRSCLTGGDAFPVKLQEDFLGEFGVPLHQVWGCSEAPGALTHGLQPGPVSRVLPGTEVRIVDGAGQDVPRGATGELVVRDPGTFVGYWTGPGRLEGTPPDGWFRTGDLFRQGDGDDLWFVTRRKHLIVRGGSNVVPAEVEAVLERHPAVRAAAVVGVPDDVLGQRVAAVVEVAGEASDQLLADVRAAAASQLAAYKVPELVRAVDQLPRNALGKVDTAALPPLAT